jgi:hypothetical protein
MKVQLTSPFFSRLHATMKDKIGGELTRWNATRFGTVFLFLQSFWDRKEKFQAWMVSNEWANSEWKDDPNYEFTYDCLMSSFLTYTSLLIPISSCWT